MAEQARKFIKGKSSSMAKSSNNWGGRRKGAGRKPGSCNRATRDQKRNLSEMAREHTEIALATLAEVAVRGSTDSARVAAAVAILDRGYGRPTPARETDNSPWNIQEMLLEIGREVGRRAYIQQAPVKSADR
ncbi:hypothetical protein N8I71_16050 [Roseibacterium sp. SDUM158016]|nr:hypothetical protein [Roseibacterium sp. SDUM158016]